MSDPGGRMNPPPKPPGKGKPPEGQEEQAPRSRIPAWVLWAMLAILAGWYVFQFFGPESDPPAEISYSDFIAIVDEGVVSSVIIEGQRLEGELTQELRWTGDIFLLPEQELPAGVVAEDVREEAEFRTIIPLDAQPALTSTLIENGIETSVRRETSSIFPDILFGFIPLLIFLAIIIFIARNMSRGQQNVFSFGKSKAKVFDAERPQITFADMAGEAEAKQELSEVVDFLKHPQKYHELGAKLPRGVLLIGPPGTGKTLLAKAVAGEAGVPFFSVSASEFVEMFVGVGASRVRDLFTRAKAASPAIVFVDEMDAVGRQRFAGVGGSNDEREQTLNQLLVEMDGFDDRQEVIVLAATNRPDVLDPALLRPGRFDRQVTIGLPDKAGRVAILQIHTRGIPIDKDLNLESIAGGTPGMSGADIANLVNEAALTAARNNRKTVTRQDFEVALDKIILGTVRAALLNEDDRRVVAYHEAGHAIVAHFSPGSDPLRKVSIVPRGRSLGVTIQTPDEDRYNYSRKYLLARMATIMGGRAAEQIVFGEITTGAQNDLKEATSLARRMVGLWGMSDEIGPLYLGTGEHHVFLGRELGQDRDVSGKTLDRADEAVQRMVRAALLQAEQMLADRITELDTLAELLMTEETIEEDRITEILGSPPVPAAATAMQAIDLDPR
jgi:cell division protease FtsH